MDSRHQLATARAPAQTLEATRQGGGTAFDIDLYHAMEERDNALIADEILNGAGSSKFVYEFDIAGQKVTGISVVGARHLASVYGGLKHRLVASTQKTGSLFVFTSYPARETEMRVSAATIGELAGEPDFYGVVVETVDVKNGNGVQVERRENRFESRRDGSLFERPNYATIAQSKARRNAILDLVPQDVQIEFKKRMLALGKGVDITSSVIDQKRSGVLQFAAAKGIPLDRRAVEQLTIEQISGLADAARASAAAFGRSLAALGLAEPAEDEEQPKRLAAGRPPRRAAAKAGAAPSETPEHRGGGDAPVTENDDKPQAEAGPPKHLFGE